MEDAIELCGDHDTMQSVESLEKYFHITLATLTYIMRITRAKMLWSRARGESLKQVNITHKSVYSA